jgi:hypothetical protein
MDLVVVDAKKKERRSLPLIIIVCTRTALSMGNKVYGCFAKVIRHRFCPHLMMETNEKLRLKTDSNTSSFLDLKQLVYSKVSK